MRGGVGFMTGGRYREGFPVRGGVGFKPGGRYREGFPVRGGVGLSQTGGTGKGFPCVAASDFSQVGGNGKGFSCVPASDLGQAGSNGKDFSQKDKNTSGTDCQALHVQSDSIGRQVALPGRRAPARRGGRTCPDRFWQERQYIVHRTDHALCEDWYRMECHF